jgi:hypothetical protein
MKKILLFVLCALIAVSASLGLTACGKTKIGVQSGTTGQYFVDGDEDWGFDGIEGYKAKGYANGGLAVQDLKNGAVKYVVIDNDPAMRLQASVEGIKVIPIPLTVEEYDVVRVSAENARGRILLKNDSFVVNKDLNGILYVDIERTADLDRKNNSAELINAAYYTCRFHSGKSS